MRPGCGVDHPPHLGAKLRNSRAILPFRAFVACYRVKLTWHFSSLWIHTNICTLWTEYPKLIFSLLLLTRKFMDSNLGWDRLSWQEFFSWLLSVVLRAWRNNRITSNRITTASLHILPNSLFGAFAKLRKATMSFVMSVCLSVRPPTWNNSAPTGRIFRNFMFEYFLKSIWKIQVSLKSDKNSGHFTWSPINIFDHISLGSS
jgi:hypothetical protein